MAQRQLHHGFTWLFLIWFGMHCNFIPSGVVVCSDGHGGSRMEWGGCDRNADRECVASCGGESKCSPGAPHPCSDVPIRMQGQIAKTLLRSDAQTVAALPVLFVLCVLWDRAPIEPPVARTPFGCDRPPDALGHIRTVVLLV